MRLIGDEHLPGKRPELPLGRITHHPRRALPHKIVGEDDNRRAVLRDPLHLLRPPAATLRLGRLRPHLRREVIPLEPARMTDELPRPQFLERTRAVPRPLVVGVEDLAGAVEANPAGGPDAGGGGDRAAVGSDAHRPAAKRHLAGKAPRQTEHDPQIPLGVELRSEGILVVVARHSPAIGDRLDFVRFAVAVGVLEPAHLRPLRRIEPVILPGQAQHFVEPVGEARPGRLLPGRVADDPDLPPPAGDGDLVVGEPFERPHFKKGIGGDFQLLDGIEVGFGRLLEGLGGARGGRADDRKEQRKNSTCDKHPAPSQRDAAQHKNHHESSS